MSTGSNQAKRGSRAFTQNWRIVQGLRKDRMVVTVETVTIRWLPGFYPESSQSTRPGQSIVPKSADLVQRRVTTRDAVDIP